VVKPEKYADVMLSVIDHKTVWKHGPIFELLHIVINNMLSIGLSQQ
jgi:hypothetical protein